MEPTYQNGLPQNQPPQPQAPVYVPPQPPPSEQPPQYTPLAQKEEKPHADVKAVLLNLGIIIALVSLYSSFLTFVFILINKTFPDALDGSSYYYAISWQDSSIRWTMALLFVGVPVYLVLAWLANRHVRVLATQASVANKGKMGGRGILNSIIIFLASVTVISNLIAIVYYFFGGEITTRFVLKSAVTLLSAGGIFWYYLYDIKRDPTVPAGGPKIGAIAVIATTLISIILGFVVIGSPTQARYQRFDQTRVSNLQNIVSSISNYWTKKYELPQQLTDLEYYGGKTQVDPNTGASYTYRVVDARHFSICAVFQTSNLSDEKYNNSNYYYGYSNLGITDWSHGVGEKCYDGYLDQDAYPDKKPDAFTSTIDSVNPTGMPMQLR
ncbi:MAG: DUF5671 domain-containing protein [Candidatus Taylorbacteria bacterium]|nr:DUF5671 domain-containing protein [Candidatus Taylorbacteria bacterium]